jgi:hypothetical protein
LLLVILALKPRQIRIVTMNAPVTWPPAVPRHEKMRRALRLFSMAMVAAALLMQAPHAHAQHASAPAGPSERERAKAQEKQLSVKETDEAYKSTIKRIPDAKQNVDPWGTMRTAPAK